MSPFFRLGNWGLERLSNFTQSMHNCGDLNVERGFPGGSAVNNPPAMRKMQEMWVQSLGQEDPLEEGMATHFSILAWRISWREEPGRLQSLV